MIGARQKTLVKQGQQGEDDQLKQQYSRYLELLEVRRRVVQQVLGSDPLGTEEQSVSTLGGRASTYPTQFWAEV